MDLPLPVPYIRRKLRGDQRPRFKLVRRKRYHAIRFLSVHESFFGTEPLKTRAPRRRAHGHRKPRRPFELGAEYHRRGQSRKGLRQRIARIHHAAEHEAPSFINERQLRRLVRRAAKPQPPCRPRKERSRRRADEPRTEAYPAYERAVIHAPAGQEHRCGRASADGKRSHEHRSRRPEPQPQAPAGDRQGDERELERPCGEAPEKRSAVSRNASGGRGGRRYREQPPNGRPSSHKRRRQRRGYEVHKQIIRKEELYIHIGLPHPVLNDDTLFRRVSLSLRGRETGTKRAAGRDFTQSLHSIYLEYIERNRRLR